MENDQNIVDPSANEEQNSSSSEEEEEMNEANDSDCSTDSNVEKCPICLLALDKNQEIGKPIVCNHSFCFPCIEEWSKVVQTCPIDRKEFDEINVFAPESDKLLRTVKIKEKISLKEYTINLDEVTFCEACGSSAREDVMLLCDGCDKGYHIDCLTPALSDIPEGNWFCHECSDDSEFESSEEVNESDLDADELADLQAEIQNEIRASPGTQLLRTRSQNQQPQISRTMQSERIRNAILARRSLRGALEAIGENVPTTSRVNAWPLQNVTPRRRRTKRRRRATKVVVEYEITNGVKFPIKTRKIIRKKRKTRKKRKSKKIFAVKSKGNSLPKPGCSSASAFKNLNPNVYDLQRGRRLAGLDNFSIFQPTNQLDYVPDEDLMEESSVYETGNGLIAHVATHFRNPERRKMMIKNRAMQNFATTSSTCNLLDSILGEKDVTLTGSNNSREILSNSGRNLKVKQNANEQNSSNNNSNTSNEGSPDSNKNNEKSTSQTNQTAPSEINQRLNEQNIESQSSSSSIQPFTFNKVLNKTLQKKKKPTFDMFDESSQPEEVLPNECPNFSIYDSVNSEENVPEKESAGDDLVDIIQMSDGEQHNLSEEMNEPVEPIVVSQPASPDNIPDLESERKKEIVEDRSYTPPIVEKKDEEKERRKKERDYHHKKAKRKEIERYNVRERLKERSPLKARDRFGRNRTRSRTRSRSRNRRSKKSRSPSSDCERNRYKKSRSHDRRRRKTRSRSSSKRRNSSNERRHKRHKSKDKKSHKKSRSRSLTPKYRREKSPRRRDRSSSDKSRRKKHRHQSKEKSRTKEVYSSGQNILVSVNFNNPDDRRSTRSKSNEDGETIDITAKKKINVGTKPVVAIIDLARSPFKELTPEYKKESNVIELSDSDGEKLSAPKSPDSTKLYDPFDILNSPPNENVSSSQNLLLSKNATKVSDNLKIASANVVKSIPLISNEENLVSSSSSVNAFQPPSKIEISQAEVVQHPVDMVVESPYSPGNDDSYQEEEPAMMSSAKSKQTKPEKPGNLFDVLFGSATPPGLDSAKTAKKSSSDPNKYLTKLKRQERVIEEVKLVIKPYYSKRIIDKNQYKEIMRKAVPKICHNKSGEINPTKIKHLIDSYVKLYTHKKKRTEPEEIF